MPRNSRNWLIQPVPDDSMLPQMSTPAMNGTTYGRKNSTRKAPAPRRCREWSMSATAKGRTTATGSASSANFSVTSRALQACLSLSRVS